MNASERTRAKSAVRPAPHDDRQRTAAAGDFGGRRAAGTRDPLGMMQYLRSVNWDATREVKSPVFDGRKLYDVRAKLIGTSEVAVPAGHYTAARSMSGCSIAARK